MHSFNNLKILITIICLYTGESCAAPKNAAKIGSSEKREAVTTIPPSNALVITQITNKQLSNNRNTYNNGVDIGTDAINNINRSIVRRSAPLPKLYVQTVFDYDDHQIAMTGPFGTTHAATKFIFSTWTTPTIAVYNDFAMWTRPNNNILRQDPQSIINSTMPKKSLRIWDTITNIGGDSLEPALKQQLKKYKDAIFTPENKTYMIIATCALVIALVCWAFAVYCCCYNLILQVRKISKVIQDSETSKCDPEKCPYANKY